MILGLKCCQALEHNFLLCLKKKKQPRYVIYNTFLDFLDDISTYVFVNP